MSFLVWRIWEQDKLVRWQHTQTYFTISMDRGDMKAQWPTQLQTDGGKCSVRRQSSSYKIGAVKPHQANPFTGKHMASGQCQYYGCTISKDHEWMLKDGLLHPDFNVKRVGSVKSCKCLPGCKTVRCPCKKPGLNCNDSCRCKECVNVPYKE